MPRKRQATVHTPNCGCPVCEEARLERELERILASAKAHGELSEPDMEIGDLQGALIDLWRHTPPEMRRAFVTNYWEDHEEWKE